MIMSGGDDKKSMASMILARMKDGKTKTQEIKPSINVGEDESDQGLRAAAEDILQAVQDKDVNALVMALKSFCKMADSDDDQEDPE
jgi:hypothetical protein